jgi:hypothetical protein
LSSPRETTPDQHCCRQGLILSEQAALPQPVSRAAGSFATIEAGSLASTEAGSFLSTETGSSARAARGKVASTGAGSLARTEAGSFASTAAYLVFSDRAGEFATVARALTRAHQEVGADLTGPWPPYSFADIRPSLSPRAMAKFATGSGAVAGHAGPGCDVAPAAGLRNRIPPTMTAGAWLDGSAMPGVTR